MDMSDANAVARFWSKVNRSDHCWEWTASRNPDGYGRFVVARKPQRVRRAHRVAWEMVHGPIPDGLNVCHHCDNPACVRPSHLFLGTQRDNVADMVAKGRWGGPPVPANCPRGHEYTEANSYWYAGSRSCRACGREKAAARRALTASPMTPAQRSRSSRHSMHIRWHERRGIAKPGCEFCREKPPGARRHLLV